MPPKATSTTSTGLPERLRAFRGLDLNLFIVFATIYDLGSVTAAGKALGLTQPAVSHALSRLRASLNDDLFVRQGSSVVPSPFARSIIEDVLAALDILRTGPLGSQQFDPAKSTAHFRLSMAVSMEIFLLPQLLAQFSQEAPGIIVDTVRLERVDTAAELARGKLSLAIEVEPPTNLELMSAPLGFDPLIIVVRKGNPLTQHGFSQETYLNGKHILVSVRSGDGGVEDYQLANLGVRRKIIAHCSALTTALRTVANTDYLVTLGRKQFEAMEPGDEFDIFDFPFNTAPLQALLVWHESLDLDPANLWLRNAILARFEGI